MYREPQIDKKISGINICILTLFQNIGDCRKVIQVIYYLVSCLFRNNKIVVISLVKFLVFCEKAFEKQR